MLRKGFCNDPCSHRGLFQCTQKRSLIIKHSLAHPVEIPVCFVGILLLRVNNELPNSSVFLLFNYQLSMLLFRQSNSARSVTRSLPLPALLLWCVRGSVLRVRAESRESVLHVPAVRRMCLRGTRIPPSHLAVAPGHSGWVWRPR